MNDKQADDFYFWKKWHFRVLLVAENLLNPPLTPTPVFKSWICNRYPPSMWTSCTFIYLTVLHLRLATYIWIITTHTLAAFWHTLHILFEINVELYKEAETRTLMLTLQSGHKVSVKQTRESCLFGSKK